MNDADAQQLRILILLTLQSAGDAGHQESSLLTRLRLDFATLTAPELTVALRGLADRSQVISHQPSFGGLRWKILSLGTAALQEARLI